MTSLSELSMLLISRCPTMQGQDQDTVIERNGEGTQVSTEQQFSLYATTIGSVIGTKLWN